MNNQNWKLKYQDLKIKFHDAVDTAFRLGFEQGAQQEQVDQAQQQQATMMSGQPGQPGQPGTQEEVQDSSQMGQEPSNGSELDQHIGELESMVAKSDVGTKEHFILLKSLDSVKAIQNDLKEKYELYKSEQAIKGIGKALRPKLVLNKAAAHNLSPHAKQALNDQEKIIDELMKSFAEEQEKAAKAIEKAVGLEQLLKV